ncbi:MAG: HD domain-containing protein [Solirubrobacteraceae bacterium]
MDVVDWARREAQHALRSATRRWMHTQAVAERAAEIAGVVAIEDRGTLVAAAYLHDIGYGADLTVTGFHPLDGAVWLRAHGRERLARLVAHHSGARFEAAARGYAEDLAEFVEERSAVADALAYCDLTTGPTGERVTVAARLGEIKVRYGPASPVTQAITAATDTLTAAAARTQARMDTFSRTR